MHVLTKMCWRFCALLFINMVISSATQAQQTDTQVIGDSAAKASVTANVFKAVKIWRGKLGDDTVQMRLQPKPEDIDSVEGEYIVFGGNRNHGNKILLAGEVTGNILTMEESEDGIDVSGQWDGKLDGNILRGKWQSDDGKVVKEFMLELEPQPAKSVKKRSTAGSK